MSGNEFPPLTPKCIITIYGRTDLFPIILAGFISGFAAEQNLSNLLDQLIFDPAIS